VAEQAGRSVSAGLLGHLRDLLIDLVATLEDPVARKQALADLGVSAPPSPTTSLGQLHDTLKGLDDKLGPGGGATADEVVEIVRTLTQVATALHDLVLTFASAGDTPAATAVEELFAGFFEMGAVAYFKRIAPEVYAICRLLGFITDETLRFDNFARFLRDTGYLSGALASGDEAEIDQWSTLLGLAGVAGAILPALFFPSDALEFSALYGWDPAPGSPQPNADAVLQRTLTVFLKAKDPKQPGTAATFTLTMIAVPELHGGAGLFLTVGVDGKSTIPLASGWRFVLEAEQQGVLEAMLGGNAFLRAGGGGQPSPLMGVRLALERPETAPGHADVGPHDRTHLEIGQVGVEAKLSTEGSGFAVRVHDSALVIALGAAGGDGDGFLRAVLPASMRLQVNLGIAVDDRRGFTLEGGTGLSTTIPVNLTIGPPTLNLVVRHVTAVLEVGGDPNGGALSLEVSGSVRVNIASVLRASVERIGMRVSLGLDRRHGDLGPFTGALAFSPPRGVGIAVHAPAITGGGFLYLDPEKGEYAGVAELTLQLGGTGVGLKAFGLLTTRLPDGREGFSLLLVMSAQFTPPIPIGPGFHFSGVGGLIGIHHTADTGALQAGLRNRSLDAILFPDDVVAAAPRILATLRTTFPVNADRYVLGPMFRIGWGEPFEIASLELAVLVDLPDPVRIVLLGQFRLAVPNPDAPLVLLRADILGIIAFQPFSIAIDASLVDSKLVAFPLGGDLALRLRAGADAMFLFSAGGYHPHFTPPPDFPALRRLSVDISGGPNPRLRLEAYLALTSNTFQIGARVQLHASAGPFSVDGFLSFDALVRWQPSFSFSVEIAAGLSLKFEGESLFSVSLHLLLEGPSPWHARGTASIEILFFSIDFTVEARWGSADGSAPPPGIDAAATITQALTTPTSWSGQLPPGTDTLVTLVVRNRGDVLVHPLGILTLRQHLLPLGLRITHIGQSRLTTPATFDVTEVTLAGQPPDVLGAVEDQFATAQFLDLTDEQKLSRPSFEPFKAGVQLGNATVGFDAKPVETEVAYQTVLVADGQRRKLDALWGLPALQLDHAIALGAVGQAAATQARRYAAPRVVGVQVGSETGRVVTRITNLTAVPVDGVDGPITVSLAEQALARHLADHPDAIGTLQLVQAYQAVPR
jgi:hypothetical protein